MRVERTNIGYIMRLSRQDTYNWAHKPGAAWPCSTLAGLHVWIEVDKNGLCDMNLPDVDAHELEAIVSDHLPDDLRHMWPTWGAKKEVSAAE